MPACSFVQLCCHVVISFLSHLSCMLGPCLCLRGCFLFLVLSSLLVPLLVVTLHLLQLRFAAWSLHLRLYPHYMAKPIALHISHRSFSGLPLGPCAMYLCARPLLIAVRLGEALDFLPFLAVGVVHSALASIELCPCFHLLSREVLLCAALVVSCPLHCDLSH